MDFMTDSVVLPKPAPRHELGIDLMVQEGKLNLMQTGNMKRGPALEDPAPPANRVAQQLAGVRVAVAVSVSPVVCEASVRMVINRGHGRSRFDPEIHPRHAG